MPRAFLIRKRTVAHRPWTNDADDDEKEEDRTKRMRLEDGETRKEEGDERKKENDDDDDARLTNVHLSPCQRVDTAWKSSLSPESDNNKTTFPITPPSDDHHGCRVPFFSRLEEKAQLTPGNFQSHGTIITGDDHRSALRHQPPTSFRAGTVTSLPYITSSPLLMSPSSQYSQASTESFTNEEISSSPDWLIHNKISQSVNNQLPYASTEQFSTNKSSRPYTSTEKLSTNKSPYTSADYLLTNKSLYTPTENFSTKLNCPTRETLVNTEVLLPEKGSKQGHEIIKPLPSAFSSPVESPSDSFPSPVPVSPGESFYASTSQVFTFPPTIIRPIPTSGVPWPLQPIPLRVPLGLRPSFGLCGVASPEEVPSPPRSSVADVPVHPMVSGNFQGPSSFGVKVGGIGVDQNNNVSSCGGVGGGDGRDSVSSGEDSLSGGQKGRSFKEFLETAKVQVETINDGKGLKNPLLSHEKSRLALHPGPLSFMTMDAYPACPVCGLKCDTPRLLHRHLRGHKEIKRYLCAWCGKGFNDTFDLKRHTRTHTGVRPYKCDSCGKAFTQRCSLESHCRKIHSQTLPFTFNERRTKLYVCEECGHSTPNLDRHFTHLRAQHPGHPALERSHHDRRQFKSGGEEGEEDDDDDEGGQRVGEVDVGRHRTAIGGDN